MKLVNNFNNNDYLKLLKLKKIEKIFKFYIPSQDAKIKSLWAPYLTPFLTKENLKTFCSLFNNESKKFFNSNFFLPTTVIIYTNKSYNFILGSPQFFNLIQLLFGIDKVYKYRTKRLYYITFSEIYFIIFIKNNKLKNYGNYKSLLKNYLSLLNNFGILIINDMNKNNIHSI